MWISGNAKTVLAHFPTVLDHKNNTLADAI
jgi:hypothetical protein